MGAGKKKGPAGRLVLEDVADLEGRVRTTLRGAGGLKHPLDSPDPQATIRESHGIKAGEGPACGKIMKKRGYGEGRPGSRLPPSPAGAIIAW